MYGIIYGMLIVLKGEPKSTSSIYRMVCQGGFPSVYMSPEGRKLKDSYKNQAMKQMVGQHTMTTDLEIDVKLYHGTHRKSDWDNFHKISMDALTNIAWLDDSQIQRAVVEKFYDHDEPRIEINIKEYIK